MSLSLLKNVILLGACRVPMVRMRGLQQQTLWLLSNLMAFFTECSFIRRIQVSNDDDFGFVVSRKS